MTLLKTCVLACLLLLVACGGSGSETPPPVEPTTPPEWERDDIQPTKESTAPEEPLVAQDSESPPDSELKRD